jgi:isoleucyl-tRNA synthetase
MSTPASPSQPSLFAKIEQDVLELWKKERVFERSIEERPDSKGYVFYDGPPFATGLPHYGHLLQSAIKDAVPRYWTMKGYRVPRRWGWDCHGLPIENLIEKDLKLGSKRDIEAFGIGKFTEACRQSVFTYENEWEKYVERLGRWVDFKRSYKTMDNDYIESVWWVFSELYKKDYVYKNVRVSLYCPRCATPLSNFEVAMGNSYVEHEDPAIYLKFPVVGEEKTSFVAWTTTPWSVPGITGLAVHAELLYVAAKIASTGETLIFAEARQSDVLKQFYPLDGEPGFEIVGRWQGSELVGKHVEVPYHFLPVEGDAYRVVAGAHVTAEAGTGVVTTAPAFGEDDLIVAKQNNLPLLFTLDDEGRMVAECEPFAGLKAKEADKPVIENLQTRGILYREERITHSVPICYRCSTLLLYKAQPAWFVDITKLKPKLLKTAQKINWHPDHFKEGRFGKGLESAPDWNISRSRYWGSPIPVWECKDCERRTVVGSVAELAKLVKPGQTVKGMDLHRPFIDEIKLPCACGKEQSRVPEVFDCWLESGSMPFASLHYPFENKKWFEDNFPADFIGEAQDQTRGWFYTLHVLATALFDKPAFKNVIVTGMILAEDGRKMSKSLKNYPDPWKVFEAYGADALRYYLLSSPVLEADALNFSERDLQSVVRGFLNLVWNVKVFYETYAPARLALTKPRSAHVLDRWLFSRLAELTQEITKQMDAYEVMRATRPLREFVDDLSTWWLRRSRERIKSDNEFEKLDALRTLREVLEELAKLMAPFTPFLADKVYQDIGGQKTSVHLERWSKVETRLLDPRLGSDMAWVRTVASRTHELRAEAKIPVRQTLASLTVAMRDGDEAHRLTQQGDLLAILRDEINVEEVKVVVGAADSADAWQATLDTVITPELRKKGARREFTRHVMNARKEANLRPIDRVQLRVVLAPGETRTVLEADLAALARDVRAETVTFVDELPAETLVTQKVEVNGESVQLALMKT